MYSSNSNNIPISYSDHPFLQRPFLNDIISSTSVFQFPSPFEDDDVYNLLHHPSSSLTQTTVANMVESTKTHITEQIPRKRCSKRDRHSKINTARGPRDRRMRLSLDVARKFFGLQDMLGYDKASKTVEWLLVQAKAEIKKLAREINRSTACSFASSTSDQSCEVVSGVDDHDQPQAGGTGTGSVSEEKASRAAKEKKIRQWRKCAFHPLARESREKARARARERTREKLRSRRVVVDDLMETQSHSLKPSTSFKPAEDNIVNDDSLVIIGTWSPSVIFSSEFLNNTAISQEHQLGDFQFFGKPWDG